MALLMALMGWLPSPVLKSIDGQTKALIRHTAKDDVRDILLWQVCRNTATGAGANPDHCIKPWKDAE
jgi:hypothetical protein